MKIRFAAELLILFLCVLVLFVDYPQTNAQPTQTLPLTQPIDITTFVEMERLGRGTMTAISLSPDGETLAIASRIGIWLYDMETFDPILFIEGHRAEVISVAWSGEGHILAYGSADATIRLWDAEQGMELAVLSGHAAEVTSLAWSPNNTILASGSADTTLRLWDIAPKTVLTVLAGHTDTINSMAWSPDGTRIASAGDKTVRVWDVAIGEETLSLSYDNEIIYLEEMLGVTWSPDGRKIAAAGENQPGIDGFLMIWDAETGEQTNLIITPITTTNTIAWQPHSRKIALGGWTYFLQFVGTKIIDLDHLENAISDEDVFGGEDRVLSLVWTPDGKRLITLEFGSIVRIWDSQTHEQLAVIQHQIEWPEWAQSSPAKLTRGNSTSPNRQYTTVTPENIYDLLIINATTEEILQRIPYQFGGGGGKHLPYVAWSPDSRFLAIQATDSSVIVLSSDTWQTVMLADLGTDYFLTIDWSPDSKSIAIGASTVQSSGGYIGIWDAESGHEVTVVEVPEYKPSVIQWSSDGSYLAITQSPRSLSLHIIYIWDVEREEKTQIFETMSLASLQWSPYESILALASERTIYLLDIRDVDNTGEGIDIVNLEGHLGAVGRIVWSTDGTRLASVSADGTVRVWGQRGNHQ